MSSKSATKRTNKRWEVPPSLAKDFLRIDDAMQELGKSRKRILTMVRDGLLNATRDGKFWLISRVSIKRYHERIQRAATAATNLKASRRRSRPSVLLDKTSGTDESIGSTGEGTPAKGIASQGAGRHDAEGFSERSVQ